MKEKTLTKAEEQIMQVLWKLEKAFLREIMDELSKSRPHQNTVATVLKVLVEKGFVGIESFGRIHRYYPLITKEQYSKASLQSIVKSYFNGSVTSAVSFILKDEQLNVKDLELLLKQLKNKKK
ncbi:MAG: BlaI/MecI/CopY family transcriptional regulator [Chitinophagaceae bacterium]|nr:BlaI/MecI/CopY family transcriptional regulator [Chitinophagaceae bacterium]